MCFIHGIHWEVFTQTSSKLNLIFTIIYNVCAKECNFSSHDEVVKFLFLTHNNNTHVCEDFLKEMKEDTTLATMLNIVRISERDNLQ